MSGEGETCEAGDVAMDQGCEVARWQPTNEAEGMAADGVGGVGSVYGPSGGAIGWIWLVVRRNQGLVRSPWRGRDAAGLRTAAAEEESHG